MITGVDLEVSGSEFKIRVMAKRAFKTVIQVDQTGNAYHNLHMLINANKEELQSIIDALTQAMEVYKQEK